MSCPQIWNLEKEKDREKEKVGRQASESQREKELERGRKNERRHFLLEELETTWNFVVAVRKLEMLAATRMKMSDGEKKSGEEHVELSRSFMLKSCKTTAKKCTKKSVLHLPKLLVC